jgi:hypothetical protein
VERGKVGGSPSNFRQVSRLKGYTGWNGEAIDIITGIWHLRTATAFVNGAKAGVSERQVTQKKNR